MQCYNPYYYLFQRQRQVREIGIKSYNGMYVGGDGYGYLRANSLVFGTDQIFTLIPLTWLMFDDLYALYYKDSYIAVEKDGTLTTRNNCLCSNGIFVINEYMQNGKKIQVIKGATGEYVSAQYNQGGLLAANRKVASDWEKFTFEDR